MPKKPFKHLSKTPAAKAPETPKANFSDEMLTYSCGRLSSVCTYVLRQKDMTDDAVRQACGEAIVCTAVVSSHFQYYDSASLADRTAALQNMAACCEALIASLADKEFEGSLDLLTAAQNCLEQCKETSGEVETEEAAEGTEVVPATAKVLKVPTAKKVSAKRRNPNWLTVKSVKSEDDEALETYSMTIDGVIGESIDDDSQVASTEFRNALAKIPKGKSIDLYIKSPGGSCLDGYDIYSALQERKGDVTVHVIAALSIASIIALGGGQVRTSLASQWMIHSPLSGTYGNEDDHQDTINMLKSFGSTMADVYSAHTSMSKDDCLAMMRAETWLTGKEAVEMGFADELDQDADEEEVSASCEQMIAACSQEKELRYAVAAYYTPTKSISASNHADGEVGHAANATQKEKVSMEKATTTVAAAPAVSLEQFNQERKMRITGEVNRRSTGKVKNDQLAWWIDQAIAAPTAEAEQAVYAQLDGLPVAAAPGGEAVRPDAPAAAASASAHPVFEIPLAHGALPRATKRLPWMEDARKNPNAKARLAMAKRDFEAKLNYCLELDARENKGQLPVASNTYSATLITDFLQDQALTILVARFAALSSFSIEFGPDRYKEYATAQTKFVTSAGSTLKGTKSSPITNFEQGDGTVVPIGVPMTHYVKSFNCSQEDFMSGLRIENLMQMNLLQFTKDVTLDALQPLAAAASSAQIPGPLNSSGNVVAYSAGTIHISAGTFGWNAGQTDGHDLASLWAYLKNSPEKNLILDGNLYGRLTNSPGYFQQALDDERGNGDRVKTFGWDRIEENTVWPTVTDAAGNAVSGLACNRQAILGVTGLPQTPPNIPGAVLQETVIALPNGLSVSMFTWFNLSARKLWNSFELMGGFAGGDASAAAVIFNGKGSVS